MEMAGRQPTEEPLPIFILSYRIAANAGQARAPRQQQGKAKYSRVRVESSLLAQYMRMCIRRQTAQKRRAGAEAGGRAANAKQRRGEGSEKPVGASGAVRGDSGSHHFTSRSSSRAASTVRALSSSQQSRHVTSRQSVSQSGRIPQE